MSRFIVLECHFPVLEDPFPVLECPFPVFECSFPVLERPFLLSKPGTVPSLVQDFDRLSQPVQSLGKIFSLSRCPFVPKSCTVLLEILLQTFHRSKMITKTLSMEGNPESSWDRELRAGSQEMLLVIYVNHATTNCLFLEPYNTTKQKITAIMCRKISTSLSFDRILCCIYFGYI